MPAPADLSPLSLVIRDERVNRIVRRMRECLDAGENLETLVIHLTPNEIREIQHTFHEALRRGERTLHEFIRSLAEAYFPGRPLRIEASVLARPKRRARQAAFIQRRLTPEELASHSDHALAVRILREITGGRDTLRLAASSIRFVPDDERPAEGPVVELVSRVKATEDICSKISDEIFRVSEEFRRDKITNQLSRYLKDVYGAKIVCASVSDCYRVSEDVRERTDLALLEVKDYIERPKATGFMAIKLVVLYRQVPLEIQILSREMRSRELLLPQTSHRTYKEMREKLRERLGPDYRRCYEFLQGLFQHPAPDTFEEE